MTDKLTQRELQQHLDYSPDDGAFTWKVGAYRGRRAGNIVTAKGRRFRVITIDRRTYHAARLAFLYMNGRTLDPRQESVFHIDGDPLNDAWDNLEVVPRHYASGPRRDNKANYTGVSYHAKSGRWRAAMVINGRNVELGTALDKHEAIALRKGAEAYRDALGAVS